MSARIRYSTAQAAEYAGCHPLTVLRALEAKELHGGQRKKKGRWSIHHDCLEAWLNGQPCEHKAAAA